MKSAASFAHLATANPAARCCWAILLGWMSTWNLGAAATPTSWFNRVLVGMEVGPTGAQFAGGKHAPD